MKTAAIASPAPKRLGRLVAVLFTAVQLVSPRGAHANDTGWGEPLKPSSKPAPDPPTAAYTEVANDRWTRIVALADLGFLGWSVSRRGWRGLAAMARVGTGVQSRVDDWSFLTLLAAEACSEIAAAPGADGILVLVHDESGMQGHVGAILDVNGRAGMLASFGHSFFSVEAQRRALV